MLLMLLLVFLSGTCLDPERIVRLLGAALSMDSLSSILKSEKKSLSQNCTQMKEKLRSNHGIVCFV